MTSTGTVHGKYQKLNAAAASGKLLITVNTDDQQVRDPVGNVVFSGPVVVVPVDGEITLTLPATDDATLSPTGFTYTAVEQLDHVDRDDYRMVEFEVPTGVTVELADLASTTEIAEDPSYGGSLNGLTTRVVTMEDLIATGRLSETDLAALVDDAVNAEATTARAAELDLRDLSDPTFAANLSASIAAAIGTQRVGLDTDDVPYFSADLDFSDAVPVLPDTDGVPYVVTGA